MMRSNSVTEYVPHTAQVVQVGGPRVSLLSGLQPLWPQARVCGPAVTCVCTPGDNLALHAALARADVGSILVCDGAGAMSTGLFGEMMATDAVNRGVAGVVVAGAVRDVSALELLGFPAFALGVAPGQSSKSSLVSVGEPASVGGIWVCQGDQIVADRDSVVAVSRADWPNVFAEAAELDEAERQILRRLTTGERLADLLALDFTR